MSDQRKETVTVAPAEMRRRIDTLSRDMNALLEEISAFRSMRETQAEERKAWFAEYPKVR